MKAVASYAFLNATDGRHVRLSLNFIRVCQWQPFSYDILSRENMLSAAASLLPGQLKTVHKLS